MRFSKTFLITGIVFYAALGILPLFTSDQFFLNAIIFVAVFALFAAAWDFGFGVAGIINLGPGVAYGIGSFIFVYFAFAHYPPVFALLGAAALASLTGFVYWIPSIRTSGSYLAIVTVILLLLGGELALARTTEEGISAGLNYYTPTLMQSYYASLGTAFLGSLILFLLSYTRFGLRLKAMRDDETAAKSVGINVYYSKLASLVISSFFLGLSGALTAFFINHTHADYGVFGITTNFLGIVIGVIGGTATIFGSIIGAIIVELPANYLTSYSTYAVIAYGATMVIVVLFLRSGILNAVTTLFSRVRRRTEHLPTEEKPLPPSPDRPKTE